MKKNEYFIKTTKWFNNSDLTLAGMVFVTSISFEIVVRGISEKNK